MAWFSKQSRKRETEAAKEEAEAKLKAEIEQQSIDSALARFDAVTKKHQEFQKKFAAGAHVPAGTTTTNTVWTGSGSASGTTIVNNPWTVNPILNPGTHQQYPQYNQGITWPPNNATIFTQVQGANKQKLLPNGALTMMVVRTWADAEEIAACDEDLLLCLDTQKYYRCTGILNPVSKGGATWEEVIVMDCTDKIGILQAKTFIPEGQEQELRKDTQEIFDAFEKNLKDDLRLQPVSAKVKHDKEQKESIWQKAKDFIQPPGDVGEPAFG